MKPLRARRPFSSEAAREALEAKRQRLIRRHTDTVAAEAELVAERESDLPDVAAERTLGAVLERLDDSDRLQLVRIARALERIDQGGYGICLVCGEKIGNARLALVPEADRCTGCSNSH